MKIAGLVALVALFAVLSCAQGEPAPSLAGTSWTLVAMGDGDNLRTVGLDPPVVLEFLGAGAELAGSTGYGGEYEGTGATFRTVGVQITARGCPTRVLVDRESEYTTALANAHSATLTPTLPLLIIEAEGKRVLIFRP